MTHKIFPSLILVLILALAAAAQTRPQQQIASVYHDIHEIESAVLKEKRSIWVRVPLDYRLTGKKYPVIYMLDGHAPQPSMMTGIIEQQVWGRQMPQMILVSIQNTSRTRDMTPTKTDRPGSGGADDFLRFIENEVIPLVEKNYRTAPYRIFAGHSLGGLTVVYALVTRPDLFNAHIAASPVLHWDDNFVIGRTERLFGQKPKLDKTLFLALGDEPHYQDGWNKFQKLLKEKAPSGLIYEFRQFPEENHASVVLRAYYWGLRKVFEGWVPPARGSISDLENHYKKLSKRYGYDIFVPEDILNRAGYQMLGAGKTDEAIELFRKNVRNYPESANVYDSLGEALEKKGRLAEALENYEKAYKIASDRGDERLAAIFKANLERVSDQLEKN